MGKERGMGSGRSAVGRALVGVLVVGVLFGVASSGNAASPTITFSLDCSPALVTPGGEWGCSGSVENLGPQASTHDVTLVQEIAGATLVSSSFDEGVCEALEDGGITCDLGGLQGGDAFEFTTIFQISATASGTQSNNAYARYDSGIADGEDTGQQEVICANTLATTLPCTGQESTDAVATGDADDRAGGHVAFVADQSDTLATSGTPSAAGEVFTELTIPFREEFPLGFGATIVEDVDPAGDACPVGVSCFGQTVIEDLAGDFDADDPVVGTFRLIAPKGTNEKTIVVYHDGVAADSCTATPLSETVDTCVFSRSRNPKTKVVTIVVNSTDNGSWDFG
jgi:hypothetical protein